MNNEKNAIEIKNITKIFSNGVVANKNINFKLKYGEIHAILGENGAGKSTLIKILLGELNPTSGLIKINDTIISKNASSFAKKFNMSAVHQHFSLIDNFSVFENVILGFEKNNQKTNLNNQKEIDKVNIWYDKEMEKIKKEGIKLKKKAKINLLNYLTHDLKKKYQKKIFALKQQKQEQNINFFCYQKSLKNELNKIINKFNLNLNLNSIIDDLSVTKKQKTEILKVLFKRAKIIIFDEPTSVISLSEIDDFLNSVLAYKKAGKAIVFISHKVNEIKKIADFVTVLRRGKVVGSFKNKDVSVDKMVSLMIGEKKLLPITDVKTNFKNRKEVLSVKNLNLKLGKKQLLQNINFSLYSGEIVGIAGIEENGQRDLLRALTQINNRWTGDVIFSSKTFNFKKVNLKQLNSSKTKKLGIAYVSKDRQNEGLLIHETLYLNTFFNNLDYPDWFFLGLINKAKIIERTKKIVSKYDVNGFVSIDQKANSLSGGNQQKFIIGRELETNPELLLIDEPSWGIDVGTINNLNHAFIKMRNKGKTILFVSANLDLILSLSDRVLVMNKGRIISELKPSEKDVKNKIGILMSRD